MLRDCFLQCYIFTGVTRLFPTMLYIYRCYEIVSYNVIYLQVLRDCFLQCYIFTGVTRLFPTMLYIHRCYEIVSYNVIYLQVLRDCFLQLKAFENEDSEDQDETDGKSIQEKLKSMLDVSAVCIYLNKS